MSLTNLIQKLVISNELSLIPRTIISVRNIYHHVEKPKPGKGQAFRRIVHYPEKYTVKPLNVTNLGGRDPVSGRLVAKGIGGGIKHKYHWIDWKRVGATEGPPQEEKVIKIIQDGCRTSFVALVAYGDKLKYILATENMKPGDIIRTSMHIPRIPVRPQEGDAYPLGALPLGTKVHNVEMYAGTGGCLVHAAGTFATIVRRTPDHKVVVQLPSKREYCLPQNCMCTVGRLSNVDHGKTPIGSAQRNRELGNRPRSGLWKRKTGFHGRKIRPLPAMKILTGVKKQKEEPITLSLACMPVV